MRRSLFASIACVCFALSLGACGLLAPRQAFLTEPLQVAPAALGERTVEQRLLIRWPGGERVMDAVLEITPEHLRLVMLAFGMRLASLEYNGVTLTEQRFVPHAPEGKRILNDFLVIAAPLENLRRALPPGASVVETFAEGKLRREIFFDGVAKIVVDFETSSVWQGKVRFKNIDGGYELILESHEI